MKTLEEIKKISKLQIEKVGIDSFCGWIYLNGLKAKPLSIIGSWCMGWEHVSVAYANKLPSWDEMCKIKSLFWNDNECVVQYHPPKSEYVNNHPYCLHLWKQIGKEFPIPPKCFV